MSEKKLSWRELDLSPERLEELKKEAGFKDFTKLNALRIASRIWISEKGNSLKKCVERTGKPYSLLGYFLGALRIYVDDSPQDFLLVNETKPNVLLFLALRENLCGKDIVRYEENFPPFIIKAQYVKPLANAIKIASRGEFDELKKYPWLIVYGDKKELFKVGALTNLEPITELGMFKQIKKFLELIAERSRIGDNNLKIISTRDFDKAYREAFKEQIENYQFVLEMNEKHSAEEITPNKNADEEIKLDEAEEDFDLFL
jgi:hypothetical protein